MRVRRRVAAVAALLGLLVGTLAGGASFMALVLDRSARFGLTSTALSFASFLLSPVAVSAGGYWVGTDIDVATEYRSIAATMGLVGGVAFLAGFLGVAFGVAGDVIGNAVAVVARPALYSAVVHAVEFAVAGLAGAAVAEFRGA